MWFVVPLNLVLFYLIFESNLFHRAGRDGRPRAHGRGGSGAVPQLPALLQGGHGVLSPPGQGGY